MKIIDIKNVQGKSMHISYLQSGGLITNYHCSSQCKHCLYASSPHRSKDYIDENNAGKLFRKIQSLGCHSLHIGGGEPFLNINGLKGVLKAAKKENMRIEYVETNSSWFKDHETACQILEELQQFSLSRLLISISPFHNEFTPFYKVKGVISACQNVGMSTFPWISDFYEEIDSFPDNKIHSFSEYSETFGPDYLKKILQRYWVHSGGRALTSFLNLYKKRETKKLILEKNRDIGCIELTDTSHFHFDLYENYIPGLCSGIQIHYNDMGHSINQKKYPFLHILYHKGITGFYHTVKEKFGFIPQAGYISKCHLCLDIRRFLVIENDMPINEFGPKGFYEEIQRTLKNRGKIALTEAQAPYEGRFFKG